MAVQSLAETGAQATDLRPLRKWMRGWRGAAVAIAATGIAAGLGVAWTWMDAGVVLACAAFAGLFVAASLTWFVFNHSGRDKTTSELTGASEWEMRIRPPFPRDEQREIDFKHRTEGGET